MHILFAGGGTAGHINPALAIADYIKERHPDAQISYIGTKDKLEARLVPQKGYDFYSVEVSGFKRQLSLGAVKHNVKAVKQAVEASLRAKKLLLKLKPDIVIGTGGYVSGPVLRTAAKLGIKTAIHEQNAYPGVTNKMLSGLVDRVMLAMPEAKQFFKNNKHISVTGNPVRKELTAITKQEARQKLGFDSRPVILSFGGSLGARPINEAVCGLIDWHAGSGKFYHIHSAGKAGYESVKNALGDKINCSEIDVREYINDMDVCMAAADLVICRAGAITLSELAVCRKPSILIPSPYVAENHQYHNACTLKKAGAAELIEEKDLTKEKLISTVSSLIENQAILETMSKNAGKCAIDDCLDTIYRIIMELYTTV